MSAGLISGTRGRDGLEVRLYQEGRYRVDRGQAVVVGVEEEAGGEEQEEGLRMGFG
jgi:hypothetical protein